MLKWYRADLHIHTCLSPCADLTISPKRAVARAVKQQLDMIAICDHNSAENVQAACAAGKRCGLTVLPGIEITTREEVHLLGIFDRPAQALELQAAVYARLADGKNDEKLFGSQIIANEFDEVEGYNPRLLIGATSLSLTDGVRKIRELDGLVVAAHVDREAFSIIGQLGFIPDDLDLDALELSSRTTPTQARKALPACAGYPLYNASDAHELKDIGRTPTRFRLAAPTVRELRRAFRSTGDRTLRPEPLRG